MITVPIEIIAIRTRMAFQKSKVETKVVRLLSAVAAGFAGHLYLHPHRIQMAKHLIRCKQNPHQSGWMAMMRLKTPTTKRNAKFRLQEP
jgi:hypothetical protein